MATSPAVINACVRASRLNGDTNGTGGAVGGGGRRPVDTLAWYRCRESADGYVPVSRTSVDERITIMTNEEIAEILAKPYRSNCSMAPSPPGWHTTASTATPESSRSVSGRRATGS
jgi:hypothetical protein